MAALLLTDIAVHEINVPNEASIVKSGDLGRSFPADAKIADESATQFAPVSITLRNRSPDSSYGIPVKHYDSAPDGIEKARLQSFDGLF
jgi:hypothetical protein